MASPPLSEFTSFSFQGTSLDSSWHGITRLDSSAEDIIQDTSLNYSLLTTNQWVTRSLKKASLQLDEQGIISVQITRINPFTKLEASASATPTPGWED